MPNHERITVVNAYGDVIKGARATNFHQRGGAAIGAWVGAPGYQQRKVFYDFNTTTADVVMLVMDSKTAKGPRLKDACQKNISAAMEATKIRGRVVGSALDFDPVLIKQDRVYWPIVAGGSGLLLVKDLDRTGAFRRVPSGLHEPHEPGYEIVGSWKTTRGAPDLQVTLWKRLGTGYASESMGLKLYDYVAELDLDLKTGAGHVFEALKNELTGSKTHPYAVNQALAWEWGIISFRLEAAT